MRTNRSNALTSLRQLAEELRNSKVVSSRMIEDVGRTRTLANIDGTKSWLPEMNKWIESIKSKVRERLILD